MACKYTYRNPSTNRVEEYTEKAFKDMLSQMAYNEAKNLRGKFTKEYESREDILDSVRRIAVFYGISPKTGYLGNNIRMDDVDRMIKEYNLDKHNVKVALMSNGFLRIKMGNEYYDYRQPKDVSKVSMQLGDADIRTTASINTLTRIATKMSNAYGVSFEIVDSSFMNDRFGYSNIKGIYDKDSDVVYINSETATADTPLHEYGHIFIETIKNTRPELYRNLVSNIDAESRTAKRIKNKYAITERYTLENQNDEILVEMLGLYASMNEQQRRKTKAGRFFDGIIKFINALIKNMASSSTEKYNLNDNYNISDNITLYDLAVLFEEDKVTINTLYKPKIDSAQLGDSVFQTEDMNTNDASDVYVSNVKKELFQRASSVVADMAVSLYDEKMEVEHKLKEKGFNMEEKKPITITIKGGAKMTLDFEIEQKNEEDRIKERKQLGKAGHKYLEYLKYRYFRDSANASVALKEFESLNTFMPHTGGSYSLFDMKNEDIVNYLEKDCFAVYIQTKLMPTDKVYTEIVHGVNMPKFKKKVRQSGMPEAVEAEMVGMAGAEDLLIDHGNDELTLGDYKFSSLNDGVTWPSWKYMPSGAGSFMRTAKSNAEMKLILNALMIRSKDRNKKFRSMYLFKFDMRSSNSEIDLAMSFADGLKFAEAYFRTEHKEWYDKNKDLFVATEYWTKTSTYGKTDENKTVGVHQAYMTQWNNMISDLKDISEERAKLSAEGKKLSPEKEKAYFHLLEQMSLLRLRNRLVGAEEVKGLSMYDAQFTNFYDKSNPIVKMVGSMYFEAVHHYRKELQSYYDAHDKHIAFIKRKQQSKMVALGSDYRGDYSFAWTKKTDGWWLKTWKDEGWNEMSTDEKNYSNMNRWLLRMGLFSTMAPELGIKYIETELAERTDLSKEDRKFLEEQIVELKTLPKWNKFYGSGLGGFVYHEGWTPRVVKTMEESADFKNYLKSKVTNALTLTVEEMAQVNRDKDARVYSGLQVRYVSSKQDAAMKQETDYTWNNEIIYKEFMSGIIRKKQMDDVYNYSQGVKEYLKFLDSVKGTNIHSGTVAFIEGEIKALMEIQKVDNFKGRGYEIKDKDGNVIKKVSIDSVLRFNKVYWGVTLQALNIIGGIRTSLTQMIRTVNMGLAGGAAIALGNITGVKRVHYKAFDNFRALYYVLGMQYDIMRGKEKDNKLWNMIRAFNYNISTFDYDQKNIRNSKTGVPFFGKAFKWLTVDNLYFAYRIGDLVTYSSALYAIMQNIKVEDKGELKSMWDLYEVEDQKLVYKGPIRGVDNITGKEIGELQYTEIATIKNIARKLAGNLRDDEKVAATMSTLGSVASQFKNFFFATFENAWQGKFSNRTLGQYMNTKEYEILDPEYNKDGMMYRTRFAAFDEKGKKTEQYEKLEKEGVYMLPVMEFTEAIDQGYMRSMGDFAGMCLRGSILGHLIFKNPVKFKEEWNKMSDVQKLNVFFAMQQFFTYLTLIGIIAMVFGDSDEDDKSELWKLQAIMMADDTIFETIVVDPKGFANTVMSVPSIKQTFDMADNVVRLVKSSATDETIKTGKYKDFYKGFMPLMKQIPGVRTGIVNWEYIKNWEEMEIELDRSSGEGRR